MRKSLLLAAVVFGLVAPQTARAGFFYSQKPPDQYGFKNPCNKPRAAPWYLYWPYPAYFNLPAPTGVQFGPEFLSPGGFGPHMYQPGQFTPYPTNGFGQ